MKPALSANRYSLTRAVLFMLAWLATSSEALSLVAAIDLGDRRAQVTQQLGVPLRAWAPSQCPARLLELRRRGGLWLKLVYGPDDRVRAAGVFRLALAPNASESTQLRVALRWPGLAPGAAGGSAYPSSEDWRPLVTSIGAKQWLWLEESHDPSDPPSRLRYLGSVVVDDASGFAGGRDFPHDVAEAITATGPAGPDWARADMVQPLLAWRRSTLPNVYIETLLESDEPGPGCGALTLAIPDYIDFLLAHR